MTVEEIRTTRTDKVRFRLQKRWFNDPVLVLQIEMSVEKRTYDRFYSRWSQWSFRGVDWADASLEDLSVMNIKGLSIQRDGGEMPACFRPYSSFTRSNMLVLQVLNGAVQNTNSWRDARMQDLLFKDGNFMGGVGLVSR